MTRGNQRDQDRLKAQKKAAAQKKAPKESAANLAKRKEAYVRFSLTLRSYCNVYDLIHSPLFFFLLWRFCKHTYTIDMQYITTVTLRSFAQNRRKTKKRKRHRQGLLLVERKTDIRV